MRRSLGSVTPRGKGVWLVQVTLGYDPDSGKRIRHSETVRGTRKEAEAKLSTLLVLSGHGTSLAKAGTVEHYLASIWLPSKSGVRRKTQEGYKQKVDTLIVPYIGTVPMTKLDTFTVERWLTTLSGKVSAQSVRHARAVLKNAMRAAVRWGIIDRDPTEGTRVAMPDYEPEVLDAAGVNAYLDAFAGHYLEPIVVLAIAAGLRRSELVALEWSDIDFDEGTVSVTKGLHQSGRDVWTEAPKSQRSRRVVPLPLWALDTLRPLRGVGSIAGMAPDAVSHAYRAHLEQAKLHYIPLRNLRHTSGTLLMDGGVDISIIADRLGHSEVDVTRQHYLRPHRVAQDLAVKVLGDVRQLPSVAQSQKEVGDSASGCANS